MNEIAERDWRDDRITELEDQLFRVRVLNKLHMTGVIGAMAWIKEQAEQTPTLVDRNRDFFLKFDELAKRVLSNDDTVYV